MRPLLGMNGREINLQQVQSEQQELRLQQRGLAESCEHYVRA